MVFNLLLQLADPAIFFLAIQLKLVFLFLKLLIYFILPVTVSAQSLQAGSELVLSRFGLLLFCGLGFFKLCFLLLNALLEQSLLHFNVG